jgi:acyl carrier protein
VSDQRLEAVAALRRPVPVRELQDHLRRELPDYMVPGVVRVVDALPRLSNGKLDRQGLLAVAAEGAEPGGSAERGESVEPAGSAEPGGGAELARPPVAPPPPDAALAPVSSAGPAPVSSTGPAPVSGADPDTDWMVVAQGLLAEVLAVPVDRVDPAADFFALGGHSLLLLRLGAEIERRHAVDVEMDELLARPTAAQLGSLLADRATRPPRGTDERTTV